MQQGCARFWKSCVAPENCRTVILQMPTLQEKIEANAASRLALPPNRKPAQELARYKNFLKVESHRLKILHRAGGGGREICRARATLLDVLLRYLLEGALRDLPRLTSVIQPPIGLVAIGGFGRAELNPYSDIDYMLLFDSELISRSKPHGALSSLAEGVMQPLWDLG